MKDYYRKNREKAKEYQKLYYLNHKKKSCIKDPDADREKTKSAFTARDIIYSSPEKAVKIFDLILKGERQFITYQQGSVTVC